MVGSMDDGDEMAGLEGRPHSPIGRDAQAV
jgi:hypothetical protein